MRPWTILTLRPRIRLGKRSDCGLAPIFRSVQLGRRSDEAGGARPLYSEQGPYLLQATTLRRSPLYNVHGPIMPRPPCAWTFGMSSSI